MNTQLNTNGVKNLIKANYERMMAYENAYHASSDPALKDFLAARADESEKVIEALQSIPDMYQDDATQADYFLASTNLFECGLKSKSSTFIHASVKSMETSMRKWYKSFMTEIQKLPDAVRPLVKQQHSNLQKSEILLAQL